ncbi:MAG TPA: lytic transglycosylase domain-containing protein [Bryobacteraceae bacterium]|nr:lytic transglycosylase domain-containing protein [Bryobacteraceae bacterium]
MIKSLVLLVTGVALAFAQPPANFEESVRAAMAPAIAQQRAAVQKQAATVRNSAAPAPANAFFTVPFTTADMGTADCEPLPDTELDALTESAAQKSGVDKQLVRAVIDQESGGRPCALSARGAQGLMQLMPDTADGLEVQDAFDPKENVEAGAKLLKSLLDRYNNDASLALGAYNAGWSRVDQAGGVPQIPETTDYVTEILNKLNLLKTKNAPDKPAN